MKLKRLITIAAVLGVLALTALPVFAQEQGGGTGTLEATGDGLAGIKGDGTVTVSGDGMLWIQDLAGDASINVTGQGNYVELPNGWIRYQGFDGSATVSGSSIIVALNGTGIELTASGTGKYILRGEGSWMVYKEDGTVAASGQWTEKAEPIDIP